MRTFWLVVVPVTLLGMALAAVAGVLVIDRLVMPNIVDVDKGIVSVPAVLGLDWEQARQRLYDIGLVGRIRTQEFNDTVAAGAVIRQYLDAGAPVKRGRHIDVAVSKGAEVGVVPGVQGLAEHLARLELRSRWPIVSLCSKILTGRSHTSRQQPSSHLCCSKVKHRGCWMNGKWLPCFGMQFVSPSIKEVRWAVRFDRLSCTCETQNGSYWYWKNLPAADVADEPV